MRTKSPARWINAGVAGAAALLVACASPPTAQDAGVITAAEIAGQFRTADVVADARLESFVVEAGADLMTSTMVWTVTRCHAGACTPGQVFRTRQGEAFATGGRFCNARQGCLSRDHLQAHVGHIFLATFTRHPYIAQSTAHGGEPQQGHHSLNRGVYLIHRGQLYSNGQHRLVDASHAEVVR